MNITQLLATELAAKPQQINAAITLLDEGATVPFIARYRKEVTGGLDDTQLRLLSERLSYLRELIERKQTILKSIDEQGKLSPELAAQIEAIDNKTALEDVYLPYKPKRRTKAQIAREAGLDTLAQTLWQQPETEPEAFAAQFIDADKGVNDTKAALDGARAILMEQFAEDAVLLGQLRQRLWQVGELRSEVVAGQEQAGEKFQDYFQYQELLRTIPSHRSLAVLRGRNEGVLALKIVYQADDTPMTEPSEFEQLIAQHFNIADKKRPADKWLKDTVRLTWRAKLFLLLELDAFNRLKSEADAAAITVFARNLKDLLLAAPAGRLVTLGLDPGIRTGVKVAVVDDTGKLLATDTVYPFQPRNDRSGALNSLAKLIRQHKVQLIAIGNGTASRETDQLAAELIKALPEANVHKLVVSEAGASVYSASELAAKEFPDLDVSLRGAVSIARRLQDPLAELVKIDPKSIGVGQYQHDVNQVQLAHSLDAVVEDCVNAVGVDVNTASVPLLARVSGLNQTLAQNIVAYRDENGAFKNRKQLKKVPRLGEKTFEQAAGFLRIQGGSEPLDASAVHPEAYPIVTKMLADAGVGAEKLIGNTTVLKTLQASRYIDDTFGLPTVLDILTELEKPGRDPRGEFKTATFADGVDDIKHLVVGSIMEGVVTNVAAFGAFVDIGVHQDGLVHISALSNQYVSDPHKVVKAGQVVKVKVMSVDVARKRIALTMRLNDDVEQVGQQKRAGESRQKSATPRSERQNKTEPQNAMAAAFAKLKR